MWKVVGGIVVVLHGIVTVLVWSLPPGPDVPMQVNQSWLLGEQRGLAMTLASISGVVMTISGAALLAGQDWWSTLGLFGGALSLLLFALFFTPWWLLGIALSTGLVAFSLQAGD